MTPDSERIETTRLSDDGLRLITVTRWLDRQVSPPRWRSKNRHRKLKPNEVEYYRWRPAQAGGGPAVRGGVGEDVEP